MALADAANEYLQLSDTGDGKPRIEYAKSHDTSSTTAMLTRINELLYQLASKSDSAKFRPRAPTSAMLSSACPAKSHTNLCHIPRRTQRMAVVQRLFYDKIYSKLLDFAEAKNTSIKNLRDTKTLNCFPILQTTQDPNNQIRSPHISTHTKRPTPHSPPLFDMKTHTEIPLSQLKVIFTCKSRNCHHGFSSPEQIIVARIVWRTLT